MNTKQNKMNMIIITLVIALGCLTLAYAVLSTTLNINFGNVTQGQLSWDIGFKTGSVTGVGSGTSDTGRTCGTATVTSDTVTVAATTLSKPEDKCVYALEIQNKGGVAAQLQSIVTKTPTAVTCTETQSTMVCGNITYKLTSDANGITALPASTTLDASQNLPAYLIVEYTGSDVSITSETQTNAGFTLTYNQK